MSILTVCNQITDVTYFVIHYYTIKVVASKKWCKIDTPLLHITNRKYHMALNDLE